MTFKDDHPEMQHLARELNVLRTHNLGFAPGARQDTLLMMAEAAICVITLERFLRILLGRRAHGRTMHFLLMDAERTGLLQLPQGKKTATEITCFRDAILHANFEQQAERRRSKTIREYFGKAFGPDLELVYRLADHLVDQIDPETGKRRPGRKPNVLRIGLVTARRK